MGSTDLPSGLRPAVFLDRDGTLIQEKHYLSDPREVSLLPGVAEALVSLRDAGFLLVVATNQSGIARGLVSPEEYRSVEERLKELLRSRGVSLDATFHCPHHPDITGPCPCRKPATGMFLDAARLLGIDLRRSYFVGDRARDVLPAGSLGGQGVLVLTGYGAGEEDTLPPGTPSAAGLPEAVRWILEDAGMAGR